jgi:hypothetical protein
MTTAYVDYDYYTDTYLGTDIAEDDFDQLALRASAVIDQITFNRAGPVVTAGTDTDTIDLIQMAACAVAEELQTQSSESANGVIQSESVGRHSVTYAQGSVQSKRMRQSEAAQLYLGSTGLMFRGFTADEWGG